MFNRDEMFTALSTGIYRVVFEKVNGETRDMTCTRQLDRIPEDKRPKGDANITAPGGHAVPAFDTSKQEWRSFRADKVTIFEKKG